MMKLVFLGAGASVPAQYPTAGKLLDALEEAAARADLMTREGWKRFKNLCASAEGILQPVLESGNLELTITLLDLFAATIKEAHESFLHAGGGVIRGQERARATWEELSRRFNSPKWQELEKWERIRLDFVLNLANFFEACHFRDSKAENMHARDYIRRHLCRLEPGDVVITTNWDTVAERTLLEEQKWGPSDGYGFDVSLRATVQRERATKVPEQVNAPSPVKVLKLHGSIGWFVRSDGKLYLRHADFLEHFAPEYASVWDESEPDFGHNDDPALINPSYIKKLTEPALHQVWEQAQQAVMAARTVTILGYSLPDADTPVRVLLNPLRGRLHDCKVRVVVVDKSLASRNRWRDFLGEEAMYKPSCIENWNGQCEVP